VGQKWVADNNLKLNCGKSKELISAVCGKHWKSVQLLLPCLNTERVNCLQVLGVYVNDQLTAVDHVTNVLTSCTSLLNALRVLHSHGIPDQSLHDASRATVIGKLLYCAHAWSGGCSATGKARLDSFGNKCRRL
jgi:hypothetical protein